MAPFGISLRDVELEVRQGEVVAIAGVAGNGQGAVPMQGTIGKVLVAVGDTVGADDPVCVLEAMKMENNVPAGKAGTVAEVRVAPGDSVGAGDVVVVIE